MFSYSTVRRAAIWIVALHAAVSILHGITHSLIPVPLGLFEFLYVMLVIAIAPPLGVWLMLRPPHYRRGAWLLLAGMAGALIFGLVEHFILPGADNVAQIPAGTWQGTFQWTSAGLFVTEALGTLVGLVAVQPQVVMEGQRNR